MEKNNALRQELQDKDTALDAALKEKDLMIKQMGEKEAHIMAMVVFLNEKLDLNHVNSQAQLDVDLQLDLTHVNTQHLQELELQQPTGFFSILG